MRVPCALIVDDEPAVRELCARVLSASGWRVLAAASVDEAIRLMGEGAAPDLVLTDVEMPGRDGWALAQWVRANRPGARVGMMTGAPFPDSEAKARAAGAAGFLAKPFQIHRLEELAHRCRPGGQ